MTLAGLASMLGRLPAATMMNELINDVHVAAHGVLSGSIHSIEPSNTESGVHEAERMLSFLVFG